MAARHDIIHIDFQANAGKANAALQTLQTEAAKARDKVTKLRNDLQTAMAANMPTAQIDKMKADLKQAETESRQWSQALQNNMKGVRALDDAIKIFNSDLNGGKGSVEGMSAALSKAARNAAQLQQSRETRGSQTWKEMEALIIALDKNIAKANIDIANLVSTVQNGGKTTKAALTQAKTDLEQLMTMTVRGSKEWNGYNKQLKVVTGELNKIAEAEKKAAQADQTAAMTKRMRNLKSMSSSMLSETKRFWEAMVAGAKKGSAELAEYEAKLKKVQAEEKKRMVASAEQILASPNKFGVDQIRQAVQQMTLLRDSLQQGIPAWNKYNSLVKQGSAYLQEYAEREKISRGEAMSLSSALRLASNAGGQGFKGTAQQLQQAQAALEKAAASAKKGGLDWTKYQEALAKVRVEMSNASITSERMQEILAKPANAKNLNELAAAVKRAKAELDLMAETVGKDSKAYTQLAESTKKAEIQLKSMQAQAKGTASSFDKAWSRLKTYIGLYMGAAVAIQKLTATLGDITDLSDKMGEVRKTTGFTADEVGRLSNNLRKLDVRTPLVNLMEVAAAAGQLGLKTIEDVEGFTIAANKLMIALPEMGKEAATEMMRVAIATGEVEKIRKQLQEGTIEGASATAVAMEKIASTIDRLRATSASTAPEITDFVKRVGAVGAQSGITIDQVSALGSTISSLGMRVEMSATALSRMIPAIKNNAFDIARAIGVTPDTIRDLFDAGRGMEAILLILQHMKDSGMDEDSIETMMGMGSMRDIMKDLNQQGARAGIVFAGLSQNVDELRRQLGVASEAYEENIAVQQEFEKMNETTAAKWERLKNTIEELFVGDQAQRWLGGIIDGIKSIVDMITGPLKSALMITTVLFGAFRLGIGEGVMKGVHALQKLGTAVLSTKASVEGLRASWAKLESATKANIFGAVAAALTLVILKVVEWKAAIAEARREIGRWAQEIIKSEQAVDDQFKSIEKAKVSVDDANKKVRQAEAALKAAKEQLDGSKESTDRLTKAEGDLKKAEDEARIASDAHRGSIEKINSIYGKYLGFMLSEISSAAELANARELINAKLRETITLKRKEAALGRIEEKEGEGRDEAYGTLSQALSGAVRKKVKVGKEEVWETDNRASAKLLRDITKITQDVNLSREQAAKKIDDLLIKAGKTGDTWKSWRANIQQRALDYQNEYRKVQTKINATVAQFDAESEADREESQKKLKKQYDTSEKTYQDLEKKYESAAGEAKKKAAANLLKQADTLQGMISAAPNYYDLSNAEEKDAYDKFIKDSQARIDGINGQREQLLKEAGHYYRAGGGSGGGGGGANPWGGNQPAESTAYTEMNAEQLVTRRKQMKDFVNAIQSDSDVKAVLAEDKALQKAIREGMSSDFRTVVEWYNTERLKIQDELNARHLTNTGDWKDPKQEKARKKRLQEQWRYYLDEIDAYYTERKTRIQEAANEEGVTQAEVQNRTLANEAEWHQRRAELQKLYAGKAAEVTRDEQDALFNIIADRTDDDVKYIEKSVFKVADFMKKIGEKSPVEYKNALGKLDKEIEKDFFQQQTAIQKQLKTIQDIIDKERPFNGITKNLRENLVTMGILTADMTKERNRLMKENADMSDFNARQAAEEVKRTVFMLGEAENAYTATVEEVMKRMADAGMKAWADELKANPKMQEGLMAQLRATYDSVQEAIKKEASQMKKQAEIMWNNVLLPGGDGKTTVKDAFEKAVSQLGIAQGRVSRASSMIGAGQASERVADNLAIRQMRLQLAMQTHYYNLMQKQGQQRVDVLREQEKRLKAQYELLKASGKEQEAQKTLDEYKAKSLDRQHAEMSLNLATTKEQTELDKQREEIIARTEESQARLYKELQEWGELISSSLQSVFEASNTGNKEYYNERAKLNLTGKGGPGAGTYIITENAGTSDAKAHYEYLDERQALERQHEIEQQNAQADAWKKVMDDINQKMSETITDQINAMMQNAAVVDNTTALGLSTAEEQLNTLAVQGLTERLSQGISVNVGGTPDGNGGTPDGNTGLSAFGGSEFAADKAAGYASSGYGAEGGESAPVPITDQANTDATNLNTEAVMAQTQMLGEMLGTDFAADKMAGYPGADVDPMAAAQAKIDANNLMTDTIVKNKQKEGQVFDQTSKKEEKSTGNMYAKMTQAANLYGVAYQAMANDNLSTSQKFQMIAVQAAGQAAISMLTADFSEKSAETVGTLPAILAKCLSINPIAGAAIFAVLSALLGGMLGMAVSKIAKGKQEIAQATGASVGAGRLSTGMMTYAEGNVNELTDPNSLTPGRHYNVDGDDGRTYRAKYMGKNAKTHITTGPEFHLVGEKGREAIIDAHTTRNIQMNDPEIWHTIQTLYNGGSMSRIRSRRGRGVRAFAEGNVDEFDSYEEIGSEAGTDGGFGSEQMAAFQSSIDRNNELLERALTDGIKGVFNVYGDGGLVDSYDKGKKTLTRHGEKR